MNFISNTIPVSVPKRIRNDRPRVLILNHTKVQCGVFQFGKRVYALAAISKKIDYFYKEIDNHSAYLNTLAEVNPDYVIYNWHWDRMPWLKASDVTNNKEIQHYFIYHDGSMMTAYDKYLFFGDYDPKKQDAVYNRVLLPRPLFKYEGEYPLNEVPTIGSFGFAFVHKKFPELVTMVNNQFSEAVINIHMTLPYFGDTPGNKIKDIIDACHKNNFRKEIKLNITQHFLDDQALLTFLAKNDINVFAYSDFDNPGLSSALDYALSVKRPIAISRNMMFRHIASESIMLERNSIKDILSRGIEPLKNYHDSWSVDNFTSSMEKLFLPQQIEVRAKSDVLFVNHKVANCGIYQFGKRLYEQVKNSEEVKYSYLEVESEAEVKAIFNNPPKHIIFNWNPTTMPFLTEDMVVANKASKHYFIFHDAHYVRKNYDKYFFFGDYDIGNKAVPQTKSILFPRPLFQYNGEYPVNEILTVGSFGFGFWQKGYQILVKRVHQECKKAVINLHMPYSYYGDRDMVQTNEVIATCKKLNNNPDIKLNITQSFLTNQEILEFLAKNDINMFLYSENGEGISSATDYALSVNRPIMITNCQMFRHFKKNEICAECNSIQSVCERGLEPLKEVREKWSADKLVEQMDGFFSAFGMTKDGNKILGDLDRTELLPLVTDMFAKCPKMMATKYPAANVQQAFILNEILRIDPPKTDPILCVGCVDDTAAEYLRISGYNIIGIDPEINFSLAEYKRTCNLKFNIIFSTSVIEHVKEDEQFTRDICELLNVNGVAILTCDFREKSGPVHPLDVRFYNEHDLLTRLGNIIASYNCKLVGEPNWKGEPNFFYEGYHYSFATWMFIKTSA